MRRTAPAALGKTPPHPVLPMSPSLLSPRTALSHPGRTALGSADL